MLLDPALVAAVLGGVDRDQPRHVARVAQLTGGRRDEPVVGVDQVEAHALAQRVAGHEHVVVHGLDPAQEPVEVVAGPARLAHAVNVDAADQVLGRLCLAAGQDVDLDVVVEQRLGQLVDVAREAALDDGRVFPREDQDALGGHVRCYQHGGASVRRQITRRRDRGVCGQRPRVLGGALAAVVDREVVADQERPVAGLQRQQLAHRARVGGALPVVRRRRSSASRAAHAMPATAGPLQVVQVARCAPRRGSAARAAAPRRGGGSRRPGRRRRAVARALVEHRRQPLRALHPVVAEELGVERDHGQPAVAQAARARGRRTRRRRRGPGRAARSRSYGRPSLAHARWRWVVKPWWLR